MSVQDERVTFVGGPKDGETAAFAELPHEFAHLGCARLDGRLTVYQWHIYHLERRRDGTARYVYDETRAG